MDKKVIKAWEAWHKAIDEYNKKKIVWERIWGISATTFTDGKDKFYESMRDDKEAISKADNDLALASIKSMILKESFEGVAISYFVENLNTVLEKYSGKRYGDKTRGAIREELNTMGYDFYNGYSGYDSVYVTNPKDNKEYCISGIMIGGITDKENVIHPTAKCNSKFDILSPAEATKKARAVLKAVRNYKKIESELKKKGQDLAFIAPRYMERPDIFKSYSVNLQ